MALLCPLAQDAGHALELTRLFPDAANWGDVDVYHPLYIYDPVFEADITDSETDCESTLDAKLDFLRHRDTYKHFFVAQVYSVYGLKDLCCFG